MSMNERSIIFPLLLRNNHPKTLFKIDFIKNLAKMTRKFAQVSFLIKLQVGDQEEALVQVLSYEYKFLKTRF